MLCRLPQPFLAKRHRTDLAGQSQFAERDQGVGQRHILQARTSGQYDRQIAGRLRHAYAANHVGEHILTSQQQAGMAMRHRQQHRQPIAVNADRDSSRVAAEAGVGEDLHLDQQ